MNLNIKRYLFLALLLFAVNSFMGVGSLKAQDTTMFTDKEVTVKTMTYNIYSARKQGIQAIADVIKKANPDLVSLQEVEQNTKTNPMEFAQEIAKLTEMEYYYFAHALDIPTGGDYGNVILSKYPLSEEQTYKLSVAPGDKDDIRSLGIAKVEKDGKQFYFATTHLGYRKDDATRLLQISELLTVVRKIGKPIIIGGDFNSRVGSATMPALQNHFTIDCLSDSHPWTVPAPSPNYACDWLLYAPKEAFKTIDYSVGYWARYESDHFPVMATYIVY